MAQSARDVARRVVQKVITQNAFISLTLGAELDKAGLDPRDRRLATELVYGVCRHLGRIDRALAAVATRGLGKVSPAMMATLRVAAYQLLFLDRVPDHAAVSDAVSAARRLGGPRMAGFANGILRALARDGEPPLPPRSDALAYIEAAHSLPRWLIQRLQHELGPEDDLFAAAQALSQPAPLAIRVNRRRITRAALTDELRAEQAGSESSIDIAASPVCPDALLLTGLGDPERSPSFAKGLWTVQDVGAQLIGRLVDMEPPEPPSRPLAILDACAGVGGKSTHMSELYGDRAVIDAADLSERKLMLLRESAARLGAGTIRAYRCDLTRPEARLGASLEASPLAPAYDAVLLDAPCTGLGVIRRHPETLWRVREADIPRMAELQRMLLDALAPRVRPGGVLVYSVCTFTSEEGPAQIAAFLQRHPRFILTPPTMRSGDDSVPWPELCPQPGILRTWPHRHGADAFFAARLVCRES